MPWRTKRLGDVLSFDKRITMDRALRYLGLENIESNTGAFVESEEPANAIGSAFRFDRSHVLYGRLRPYLNKVFLPDEDGRCSTEIFPLLPTSDVLREFLFYWLLADETSRAINATCTGARMPRANMNAVLDLPISYPSVSEQKRIVAILDEAFEGIRIATANAEKSLANARELFEAKLNAVFETDNSGWIERRLGSLVTIKHGFAFKSEYFCDVGLYTLLTPGNFYERGGYRDRGAKQKFYDGPVPSGFVLDAGELLVAMTEQAAGLLGSPLIVPDTAAFLHNQRLGLVQPLPGAAWHAGFFQHLFNTKKFRTRVHRDATGVKVRHTSPEKLSNVHVRTPVDAEMLEAVADELDALKAETANLEQLYGQKLDALARIKLTILSRAFSSQLTAARERAA